MLLSKLSILLLICIHSVNSSRIEDAIIDHILTNYTPRSRPVNSIKTVLNVYIGLGLQQIVEVNEKQQYITSVVHLTTQWIDEYIHWNASDFEDVIMVRIPSVKIWQPDIFLYNMASDAMFESGEYRGKFNVLVGNKGLIYSVPQMVLKSACKMDVTWFPFDTQKCPLSFGSWTFSSIEMDVNLLKNGIDLDNYIPHGEWKLVGVTGKRVSKIYTCCPEEYLTIRFTLHIKRQTMYYFFNLIVPAFLIGKLPTY